MKFFSAAVLTLALLLPSIAQAGPDHTDVVKFFKGQLVDKGVNLSGACGAFQITQRVAWDLRFQGYKFLVKKGGNRAVPQPDGSCLDGDHTSAPGYATDYLISTNEGFVGYDLLGDGGGENKPQWAGPETAQAMVDRNRNNFGEPVRPFGGVDPVDPPPVVPPVEPPPVVDSTTDVLQAEVLTLQANIMELSVQIKQLKAANEDLQRQMAGVNESITGSLNSVAAAVNGVIDLKNYLKQHPIPDGCKVAYLGCKPTFNYPPVQ